MGLWVLALTPLRGHDWLGRGQGGYISASLLTQSVISKREITVNYKTTYNYHLLRLAAEDTSSYRLSDNSLCLGGEGREPHT